MSLGDSYGSGEGNPRNLTPEFGALTGYWDSSTSDPPNLDDQPKCHRSAFAGPAQAALKIEREDDQASVSFIHLACTGAKTNGVVSQIDVLKDILCPEDECVRDIDALIVSAGGNDIFLRSIILACMVQLKCHEKPIEVSNSEGFSHRVPGRLLRLR